MNQIVLPLDLSSFDKKSEAHRILSNAEKNRATVAALLAEERYLDAMERTVSTMRELRDFPDIENVEFRAIFSLILFDLAEIHFNLKDYHRSEKELDILFKLLSRLVKEDEERFGQFHILAMELAARIIRSRKKAIEMLNKQKLTAEALLEKVNTGVASATDRLIEALRKTGELLAAAGDEGEALRFYSEAIKFSKKRSGRVGRKEIKMTIEMAEIMSRSRRMRERAKRLLAAVLPRAIALETLELEEDIIALIETIETMEAQPTLWKQFTHSISTQIRKAADYARRAAAKVKSDAEEADEEENSDEESAKEKEESQAIEE